jgi:hypothetical protein
LKYSAFQPNGCDINSNSSIDIGIRLISMMLLKKIRRVQ